MCLFKVCFIAQVETLLLLLQSDSGLVDSDPTRAKEMTAINSVSNMLTCLLHMTYKMIFIPCSRHFSLPIWYECSTTGVQFQTVAGFIFCRVRPVLRSPTLVPSGYWDIFLRE
jgi:hypothetical protein